MADGYNFGNTIKTNAERRVEAAKRVGAAVAKGAYDLFMQVAERLIPLGATEVVSVALYPGNALAQNLDAPIQEAPTIEAPQQSAGQSEDRAQSITPAASHSGPITASSHSAQSHSTPSRGLEAYMSGNYSQDVYTPSTRAEIVDSYLSAKYIPRIDTPRMDPPQQDGPSR